MSKAAKNNKPNLPPARLDRQTRRKPSPRAIRTQLVAAGLLETGGDVVGVADHPDAECFALAASWRLARARFDGMHRRLVTAKSRGRAIPARFHEACAHLNAAEEALLAESPVTQDGVAVLLEAAADSADELPALHKLTAAALRSLKAVGF